MRGVKRKYSSCVCHLEVRWQLVLRLGRSAIVRSDVLPLLGFVTFDVDSFGTAIGRRLGLGENTRGCQHRTH